MFSERWRVELLGQLCVRQSGHVITRFLTQKTAALFAYLAYNHHRSHPREELIERFWPDDALDAGRNSLRVAISSLRRQFEPPGVPSGAVLITDRATIRLNPAAFTIDVAEFEAALRNAESDPAGSLASLQKATDLYRGDLLPGFYEDWVLSERQRLADAYLGALLQLTRHLVHARDFDRAIDAAGRAVRADPLREESHLNLIRLYIAVRRPAAALNQYVELERILKTELGIAPSAVTRQLAETLPREGTRTPDSKPESHRREAPKPSLHQPPETTGLVETSEDNQVPHRTERPELENPAPRIPLLFTRFFGREEEIAHILEMLTPESKSVCASGAPLTFSPREFQMITLTGPGGTGKTRLAVETAWRMADRFEGRVWFVPLADLTDARLIPEAIREALRLSKRPNADPLEQILTFLNGSEDPKRGSLPQEAVASAPTSSPRFPAPALLILDNFEHLVEEGRAVVQILLEGAPALICLITSRRRLFLPGEREFPVPPLPMPAESPVAQGESHRARSTRNSEVPLHFRECASVQMFVDRAQAARPDFQITTHNAQDIVAVCHLLEGIPLAIELAAARAGVLTPAQIREHLSQRFDLLVNRHADKEARHRSLRASIEWSYQLLTPAQRRFFASLSIFHGGWTLDAAQAVCLEEEELSNHSTLDHLETLRAASLLRTEECVSEMRFRMLETLREYAAERLSSEEQTLLIRRHGEYYLRLTDQAALKCNGQDARLWLDRLEREHDNLRAILDRWQDTQSCLRMVGNLMLFWQMRSYWREGRKRAEAILTRPDADRRTSARAGALSSVGTLASVLGDYPAARRYEEESLAIRREIQHTSGIIASLGNLATIVERLGETALARTLLEESLALAQASGERRREGHIYYNLGHLLLSQADYPSAHDLYTKALAISRECGDQRVTCGTLNNLGIIAYAQTDYETARSYHLQSLAISESLGNRHGIAMSHINLCSVELALGAVDAADALGRQSLRESCDGGNALAISTALSLLAECAAARQDWSHAACLQGASDALIASKGILLLPTEQSDRNRTLQAMRTALGEAAFEAALAQGRDRPLEETIAAVLDHPGVDDAEKTV